MAEAHDILGGAYSPIGWSVAFIEAPKEEVLAFLLSWRSGLRQDVRTRVPDTPYPQCLEDLAPLETPWTRELLLTHGDGWTAYFDNDIGGGDLSGAPVYVSGQLGARCVIAEHQAMTPVGHASTGFTLCSGGEEQRYVVAHAEDGRWSWHVYGEPLPFEDLEAYRAGRIRNRLTRAMVVEYLAALGIRVDDAAAYADPVIITQDSRHEPRRLSLRGARAYWGLDHGA